MLQRQSTGLVVQDALADYLQKRIDHEQEVEHKHGKACDHPEIELSFLYHLDLT